jgi:maleylpyruvate isomerase
VPDPDVSRSLLGIRESHAALDEHVSRLSDDDVRRPSLLPDWTVGHVLAHLARNADSVVRRLEGAMRGEVADQYVGGREGRAAEIERDAHRSARELVDDVRRTSAQVEAACAAMPAEAWGALSRGVDGGLQPCSRVAFSRWREVEVHLVDLGLGYSVGRWPTDLVEAWLPDLLARLPDRADRTALLAWMLGRANPPPLESWG